MEKVNRVFERLSRCGVRTSVCHESLALLFHAFLVEGGFIPVAEEPSRVQGFAPSIRDIPVTQFVPASWNADPSAVTLLYKHKSKPGKIFTSVIVSFEDTVVCTFSQRNGDSYNIELRCEEFWRPSDAADAPSASNFVNADTLLGKLESIVVNIVPAIRPAARAPGGQDFGQVPVQHFPPPLAGRSPVSVGANDLDPFGGIIRPSIGPSPSISRPEGGNVVGPNHPIFREGPFGPNHDPNGFFPEVPFLPGFDIPEPRFDPFGPVVGPNRDIDIDFDIPGAGRGRGRGRGRGVFPGEPNPDHLKPPGW